MTESEFKLLFSPIQVGKLTLRNRIVFLPHTNNFPIAELPGEKENYYFAERAKGGVGLIIFAAQYVHPSGGSPHTNAADPKAVDRYMRLTDVVHEHGSYICAQLMHRGSHHTPSEEGLGWRMPYGPSSRSYDGTIARGMDYDDIQRVMEAYRLAARHIKQGGFDGIEIRLNYGLPEEFASSLSNKRTDEYGGTLEKRLRFALEVIEAVRDEVGSDLIMDARILVDEVYPTGYGVEHGQEIAKIIARAGKIDFVNTAIGSTDTTGPAYAEGPYPLPQGYAVYAAEAIKQVVDIPVVAHGRINDPFQAEQILAQGKGDLIGMARGLIADAEFANKAREGRTDDIRRCIGYSDVCEGRNRKRWPITCVYNPAAGREQDLGTGTLKTASVQKRVMVVGGGPAGLKLAEVGARRGHQVTLYDKGAELGGQINLAMKLPCREHLGEIITHLAHQVEKLGVEIRRGVEVTPEMVSLAGPDAVVVATGSIPLIPPFPGVDQDNVVTHWDVARDQAVRGDSILIYDFEGFWPGAGIAELLANQGKKVHIVTPHRSVGAEIHPTTLLLWRQRVEGKGIIWTTETDVKAISGNAVTICSIYSPGQDRTIEEVDTVVLACGCIPNDALYRALDGKVKEVRMVGDCEAPMRIERGIYAAELLGRAL